MFNDTYPTVGVGFDLWRDSSAPEVDTLAARLAERIVQESGVYSSNALPQRIMEKVVGTTKLVLLNLVASRTAHPCAYVYCSLSNGHYGDMPWVDEVPTSARLMSRVLRGLAELKLLEFELGEFHGDSGSFRTRVRCTYQLLELVGEYRITPAMVGRSPRFQVIHLKNSEKKRISLPRDEQSKRTLDRMREQLVPVQRLIDQTFIGLALSDEELGVLNHRLTEQPDRFAIDLSAKGLYRVFNDSSLVKGGRFYGGWWMNVPGELRHRIYIWPEDSSAPQCAQEIDFSSMVPALAYASMGMQLEGDAYDIPASNSVPERHREKFRKLLKLVLLAMLNVSDAPDSRGRPFSSERRVELAVREEMRELEGAAFTEIESDKDLARIVPPVPNLIAELAHRHESIAELFYCDAGKSLMFEESELAQQIMLRLAEQNITVLPIHDSFLVANQHARALEEAMRTAFFDRAGWYCDVTFDRNNLPIRDLRADEYVQSPVGVFRCEEFVEEDYASALQDHVDAFQSYYDLLKLRTPNQPMPLLVSEEPWLARIGPDGTVLEVNTREQTGRYLVAL